VGGRDARGPDRRGPELLELRGSRPGELDHDGTEEFVALALGQQSVKSGKEFRHNRRDTVSGLVQNQSAQVPGEESGTE